MYIHTCKMLVRIWGRGLLGPRAGRRGSRRDQHERGRTATLRQGQRLLRAARRLYRATRACAKGGVERPGTPVILKY